MARFPQIPASSTRLSHQTRRVITDRAQRKEETRQKRSRGQATRRREEEPARRSQGGNAQHQLEREEITATSCEAGEAAEARLARERLEDQHRADRNAGLAAQNEAPLPVKTRQAMLEGVHCRSSLPLSSLPVLPSHQNKGILWRISRAIWWTVCLLFLLAARVRGCLMGRKIDKLMNHCPFRYRQVALLR